MEGIKTIVIKKVIFSQNEVELVVANIEFGFAQKMENYSNNFETDLFETDEFIRVTHIRTFFVDFLIIIEGYEKIEKGGGIFLGYVAKL